MFQENSLREWSFKKATTIRSYSSYHPVPVPFNIVSLGAIGLWRLCQGEKGNRFDKSGFDEKGRVRDADKFFLRQYIALDRNISNTTGRVSSHIKTLKSGLKNKT